MWYMCPDWTLFISADLWSIVRKELLQNKTLALSFFNDFVPFLACGCWIGTAFRVQEKVVEVFVKKKTQNKQTNKKVLYALVTVLKRTICLTVLSVSFSTTTHLLWKKTPSKGPGQQWPKDQQLSDSTTMGFMLLCPSVHVGHRWWTMMPIFRLIIVKLG